MRSLKKECLVCKYSNHVEVAHVKAVSKFSDDTLVSEMNDLQNLMYLCPNHHWEYDNGKLSLEELQNKC